MAKRVRADDADTDAAAATPPVLSWTGKKIFGPTNDVVEASFNEPRMVGSGVPSLANICSFNFISGTAKAGDFGAFFKTAADRQAGLQPREPGYLLLHLKNMSRARYLVNKLDGKADKAIEAGGAGDTDIGFGTGDGDCGAARSGSATA